MGMQLVRVNGRNRRFKSKKHQAAYLAKARETRKGVGWAFKPNQREVTSTKIEYIKT